MAVNLREGEGTGPFPDLAAGGRDAVQGMDLVPFSLAGRSAERKYGALCSKVITNLKTATTGINPSTRSSECVCDRRGPRPRPSPRASQEPEADACQPGAWVWGHIPGVWDETHVHMGAR